MLAIDDAFGSATVCPSDDMVTKKYPQFDVENIKKLVKEIQMWWKKHSKNSESSYTLKHKVEEYRQLRLVQLRQDPFQDTYCSNGDLIVAFLILGFQMDTRLGDPNAYFRCTSVNCKAQSKKSKSRPTKRTKIN